MIKSPLRNISVTCYGIKATKRSDVDVVTYGHLAGEVENIEFLGNLACSRAAACFKQFQAAIKVMPHFVNRGYFPIHYFFAEGKNSKRMVRNDRILDEVGRQFHGFPKGETYVLGGELSVLGGELSVFGR